MTTPSSSSSSLPSVFQLTIRLTNGVKFTIHLPVVDADADDEPNQNETVWTVGRVKRLLLRERATECGLPLILPVSSSSSSSISNSNSSNMIRLIFKGRILHDDSTPLTTAGIASGSTLFLIVVNAASVAATATATATATGNTNSNASAPNTSTPSNNTNNNNSNNNTGNTDDDDSSFLNQNPQLRQALNDPSLWRDMMQMAANPSLRRQQERAHDLQLAQIENMPGGMAALASMYTNQQVPLQDSLFGGSNTTSNTTSTLPSSANNNNRLAGATGTAMPNPWAASNRNSTTNRNSATGTTNNTGNRAARASNNSNSTSNDGSPDFMNMMESMMRTMGNNTNTNSGTGAASFPVNNIGSNPSTNNPWNPALTESMLNSMNSGSNNSNGTTSSNGINGTNINAGNGNNPWNSSMMQSLMNNNTNIMNNNNNNSNNNNTPSSLEQMQQQAAWMEQQNPEMAQGIRSMLAQNPALIRTMLRQQMSSSSTQQQQPFPLPPGAMEFLDQLPDEALSQIIQLSQPGTLGQQPHNSISGTNVPAMTLPPLLARPQFQYVAPTNVTNPWATVPSSESRRSSSSSIPLSTAPTAMLDLDFSNLLSSTTTATETPSLPMFQQQRWQQPPMEGNDENNGWSALRDIMGGTHDEASLRSAWQLSQGNLDRAVDILLLSATAEASLTTSIQPDNDAPPSIRARNVVNNTRSDTTEANEDSSNQEIESKASQTPKDAKEKKND